MAAGPETRLVNRIKAAIEKEHPSAWVLKVHGGPYQTAGVPDLFVVADGHLIGLEVKCPRPGESEGAARRRTTPRQWLTIEALRDAGAFADVVVSVEESLAAVATALDKRG